MRLLGVGVIFAFGLVLSVCGKSSVKATESMGQEIIEIGPPVKGLPPEIEEEPSAEVDDDDKPVSVATTTPPPKSKESKKTTTSATKPDTRRKQKEPIIDGDEDDAKIEKELSEIYKDNADYKEEKEKVKAPAAPAPAAPAPAAPAAAADKPIGRSGGSFKFQPDLNNPREVERFRTSIDEISCSKSVTKLTVDDNVKEHSGRPSHGCRWSVSHLLSTLSILIALSLAY